MSFKELSPPKQSYARALLYRVTQETWRRGEQYAQQERVGSLEPIPKGFRAVVRGTQAYAAELAWRGSGLFKKCACPVSGGRNPCKHLIALAIVADQSLGIPPPDVEEVESEAIPPPLISRTDIEAMYQDPLNVNLTTLRLPPRSPALGRDLTPGCPTPQRCRIQARSVLERSNRH